MLAVVHAVVREKEKMASSMTAWDVFYVLLGCTFVFGLHTEKPLKNLKNLKTKNYFLKIYVFCRTTNCLLLQSTYGASPPTKSQHAVISTIHERIA